MAHQVLFIQGGGGDEDFEADARLVGSLRKYLGSTYAVHYPAMSSDSSPDFGRCKQIIKEISSIKGEIILVGHSLGASMILKCLSENEIKSEVVGLFLIATPFWSGDEDWVQGLKLREDFPARLPKDVPMFLYHCRDDEEIPFEHLAKYAEMLPRAIVREIPGGGHQLNNDLRLVAKDIKVVVG